MDGEKTQAWTIASVLALASIDGDETVGALAGRLQELCLAINQVSCKLMDMGVEVEFFLGRNATSLAPIVHVRMPDEPLRQSPGPSMDASFAFRRIELINNNHPGAVCSSSRVKVLVDGVPVGPNRSMTINTHRPAVTMVVERYATTPKDDGR